MKICVVIPVYNHGEAITAVVNAVHGHHLHCILVDDGSNADCAAVLDRLEKKGHNTSLVRLQQNQGKGGAMIAGLRYAYDLGYSHALQIDADGQHNAADIPTFIALARQNTQALIFGYPVYDKSVPKARFYGRYATHIWVWINTLSLAIKDSMCGFRIYPLAPTIALLNSCHIGRRMDFDIDIAVRLCWRGIPIINQPTRVTYPSDGISHFKALLDNVLISRMHAKLFIGMLLRSPRLIWRKFFS
ncbi:glycosyltransferase family 2 protein [Iodobacter ciconiae]|uniref:Glycosyltransferase family 2 protein n=1 Tax=Iodobacter ciconiae TaxID=2496266 RepID=A0A3S8ZS51_9NEIS|nr:glycosyltransferase family 2 protein [Iodobacter ciconiae]AZN36306.1 glycosyltransferase family 2 protein [Iodobacter ciconiae]